MQFWQDLRWGSDACSAMTTCAVQVHDEDGKPFDIEISWVCEESGREHQRVPEELMTEATRAAKAALAESDM